MAYNGGVYGGVIVYLGFLDTAFGPGNNGFYIFGGTSAGAPQWAGVVALGSQLARRPLGFLNERLYRLGAQGVLAGLMHDVTVGDNGFLGVTGFAARPRWDLATGWGTPNFGRKLSVLAGARDGDRDDDRDDEDDHDGGWAE